MGSAAEPEVAHLGVSYASFGTVSRNDASAALKVWASTAAKERKLDITVLVEVFEREADLRDALAHQQVDAVSMTTEEFLRCGQHPENVFIIAKEKEFTQQYMLIVHRGSGIDDLPGLSGRKLVWQNSPVASLALPWLETSLAEHKLSRAEGLLSEVTPLENPSKCVLRVFFRQCDACLVTAGAFDLACELNPQLRRDLKVLATSPALVPTVFFFRPGYTGSTREALEAAIQDLHSTPSGQQVLTVFQCSRLQRQPVSCLEGTQRLLNAYHQLLSPPVRASASAAPAGTQAMSAP